MNAQQASNQKFESILMQLVEENKEIKSQITKVTISLAIQERDKFPSQPQSNPKGTSNGRDLEHFCSKF